MSPHTRVFQFEGGDLEYIQYLESRLLKAENLLSSSPLGRRALPSKPSSGQQNFINLSDSSFNNNRVQKRTTRLSTGPPQWEKELTRFISSITPAVKWGDSRKATGFATINKNRLAIQLLLGRITSSVTDLEPDHEVTMSLQSSDDTELVMRGCRYGRFVIHCEEDGQFAMRIAKYQQLVFVCYCTVLIFVGNSKDTVNWMMRQFISDSDNKNLEKYRSGCLWVNRCVAELLRRGWGYKSWELFILFAQPVHQYARFADHRKSFEIFIQSLGDGQETGIFEEGWVPYCLPCIVKFIAGDAIELSQICECLGYDFNLISWIYRVFFKASNPFDYMFEQPETEPVNPFTYTQ